MNIKICRECLCDYTEYEMEVCPQCHSPHKLSWWPMGHANTFRLKVVDIWDTIFTKKAEIIHISNGFSVVSKDRE